ncbi:MAG: serine hydrolase domain-containing protein [Chryseolinea sp.]
MRVFAFLFVLIFVFSCSPTKESKITISDELDLFLKSQYPSDQPGGAILIMKNDSVIFSKGYGLADMQSKEIITPKTLFNLGSISKTFVANAILILQEQGKLSVEDSLLKYFPNFKNKAIAKRIKIKNLLTHTSGLPDNRQVNKDTVFYLTAKDAENWYPVTQTDTLVFEPGSQYEYSNPAFNGLALIVEQVSGMKWQQFVVENIFKSSSMMTSTITDGPHPEKGVAHAYVWNHGQWTEDDYGEEPTFPAAGNGGVWSSVEELANYERSLKTSKFLKAETIADSRTIKNFPNWSDATSSFLGWSWFITQQDSLTLVGHSGSQGGFLSNYVTVPEKGIFFVILCNAPREEYEMRKTTSHVLNVLKKYNWLNNE